MPSPRPILVIADDFGIGPATSRGILELGLKGVVTGSALMVNSPYAEEAVQLWQRAGRPMELGWHPVLTQDPPAAPASKVPSLIGEDGNLFPLRTFLRRWLLGQLATDEIATELWAQYRRFIDMVGDKPALVNSHQHVALFAPVGQQLLEVLDRQRPRPFLRRVVEPWQMLWQIPGARKQRALLNVPGRRLAKEQMRRGYPGAEALARITDSERSSEPEFFSRWLRKFPGSSVELVCHPGHWDEALIGRDCGVNDARLQSRVDELNLLHRTDFPEALRRSGFEPASPSGWLTERYRKFVLAA